MIKFLNKYNYDITIQYHKKFNKISKHCLKIIHTFVEDSFNHIIYDYID